MKGSVSSAGLITWNCIAAYNLLHWSSGNNLLHVLPWVKFEEPHHFYFNLFSTYMDKKSWSIKSLISPSIPMKNQIQTGLNYKIYYSRTSNFTARRAFNTLNLSTKGLPFRKPLLSFCLQWQMKTNAGASTEKRAKIKFKNKSSE